MSFEIPPGLTGMLQDFTVAVLRTKPPDLYKFAADHFTKLYEQKSGAVAAGSPPPQSPDARRESRPVQIQSPTGRASNDQSSVASSRGEPSPGDLLTYLPYE